MKYLLVVMVLAGILFVPSPARADFFNDGRWYMDSSQWELFAVDPANRTSLVDRNNRLEWITTPGQTGAYEATRVYASKWAFDLNYDFEFNVEFHYDHIATQYPNDYGTVGTGLCYGIPLQSESSYFFATGASSDVDYFNNPVKKFWTAKMVPGEPIEEDNWTRTNDSGVLYAYYDSVNDELQFEAESGTTIYTGLKSELGLSRLGVLFAGDSDGASLISGDAYLQNFQLNGGTMVPEPVSMVLFLSGGAVLAVRRLRRKG